MPLLMLRQQWGSPHHEEPLLPACSAIVATAVATPTNMMQPPLQDVRSWAKRVKWYAWYMKTTDVVTTLKSHRCGLGTEQ